MKQSTFTISSLINDTDGISVVSNPSVAGNLTIAGALASGGSVALSNAQKVSIDSSGDDSSMLLTVTGTDSDGKALSEVLFGGNNAVVDTDAYFKTITQISHDGAVDATIEVGVLSTGGAITPTMFTITSKMNYSQSVFVDITGTMVVTVEHSATNPEGTVSYATEAKWRPTLGMDAVTSDASGNIAFPVRAVRCIITSYTSGSITFTSIQTG